VNPAFQFGIDEFLREPPARFRGARVGLIANRSCVTSSGLPVPESIRLSRGLRLAAIFTPEHGWSAQEPAGTAVADSTSAACEVPVYSLYGERSAPEPDQLKELDFLLFDLPTLSVRCYTYGSTLNRCLQAAAEAGVPMVVTDRPTPFPSMVDGPMLDPAERSFVGLLPTPLVYGLTAAETARFLAAAGRLKVDLTVVPMRGWKPSQQWWPTSLRWQPPSPALRNPACALCYPATVWTEAFPRADCGRRSDLAFQVLRWTGSDMKEPGQKLAAAGPAGCRMVIDGAVLRLYPQGNALFRPASTAVHLMCALRDTIGSFWEGADLGHLERLFGRRTVQQVRRGDPPDRITAAWKKSLHGFAAAAREFLLYPRPLLPGEKGGDR